MSASPYYRPSLSFPFTGVRTVLIAGALALASAWCYALATTTFAAVVNPFVTFVMTVWLAILMRWAAGSGHIRHPAWMGWTAAAVGLLAWYAQWVAWIVLNERVAPGQYEGASSIGAAFHLSLRPDLVAAVALEILEESESVFGKAANVLLWLAELLAFTLLPKSSAAERASQPFCEDTREWATKVEVPSRFAFIDDPEGFRRRLEANPAALGDIIGPTVDPDTPRFSELTLYRCGGRASYVTIVNLVEMARKDAPLPREALPENAEYLAQEDEPVVALLRVPVSDPDRLLERWAAEERAREVRTALAREAAAEAADKWTRE